MRDELITSGQNPRLKEVVRLRDAGGRADRIVIDGVRETQRALDAGVRVVELFVTPEASARPEVAALVAACRATGTKVLPVADRTFAKIAYGDRHEGVVAVAVRPSRSIGDLRLSDRPMVAVVEGLEKPGNLGAILRSADGAGVEAVLAADPVVDIYNANVIRASLGTGFSVPVVAMTAAAADEFLRTRGLGIVAARPDAKAVYTDVDMTGPVAMVFGSETAGLSERWKAPDILAARVPMAGRADSLNVSITAALFFYEARRQRSQRFRRADG